MADDYRTQTNQKLRDRLKIRQGMLPDYVNTYLNSIRINRELSSVSSYADDLYLFFAFLKDSNPELAGYEVKDIPHEQLENLDFNDINEYLFSRMSYTTPHGTVKKTSASRLARILTSLHGFFSYERIHGYLPKDPTEGATKPVIKAPKVIDRLSTDQAGQLTECIRENETTGRTRQLSEKMNLRDTAIVTLLLNTGIRISELVGLDVNDINFEDMSMTVIRKGGSHDKVYFNDTVAAALNDYMSLERPNYIGSNDETALFLSSRKKRLAVRSIQEMLKKYGNYAIPGYDRLSPHKLRKTYGTELYAATGDIKLVADVLGHSAISTTNRYYADTSADRKKSGGRLDLYGE